MIARETIKKSWIKEIWNNKNNYKGDLGVSTNS